MALTPEQRQLRARIAAHAQHAKYPVEETTSAGREAFLGRFEREVDPLGQLDPIERQRRANHALKSYMFKLALASAKARQKAATS